MFKAEEYVKGFTKLDSLNCQKSIIGNAEKAYDPQTLRQKTRSLQPYSHGAGPYTATQPRSPNPQSLGAYSSHNTGPPALLPQPRSLTDT
ncbi:9682_t:CDS:2 [Ambispora leptoticha]|uniref:9682_t:CDS:1 n=1 Tax=Ambispora leptoticha TaxID=144679 RepID=A0A9N8ZIX2_9GLOM|nr:9682_t:CDS:2 [Ambispora leptoticha]